MTRFEPELVSEHRAGALIRGEGIMLAARGVETAHQQRPRPLPARFLSDHALHVGHDRRRRSGIQPGLGEVFQRDEPSLLETNAVTDGEAIQRELHQGRSTPVCKRGLEQLDGCREVAEAKFGGALGGEPLKPSDIGARRFDAQPVAAWRRLDRVACGRQRLAETNHV